MTDRRWKLFGWGLEGDGLSPEEEQALLDLYGGLAEGALAEPRPLPDASEIELAAPRLTPPATLEAILSADPRERLAHTYGKSYPDFVRILARQFPHVPDLVAKPVDEAGVAAVLDWAADAGAAVIPFGGGSSVVGGIEPVVGDRFAATISLDLKGLDQVLEVDPISRAARIQAGITGAPLEAALQPHGLSLRHYPQSFAFSTLGGWLATRSGGHFATLYTHIDEFVESLRAVTPAGVLETRRLPGSGAGPNPDRLMLGSEGALGVITEAWMRLQHRPTHRAGTALGFPNLLKGAEAIRAIAQAGLYPSNLRLLDAQEARINGAGDGSFALMVVAFESADHPVGPWQARALQICRDHGGRAFEGAKLVDAWRRAFIRMPYQREFLVARSVIADTFETAITWDRFAAFNERVQAATEEAIVEATGRPGLVTCRFTHVYPDGPAPYYSLHAIGRTEALMEQWRHIKQRASDAVIEGGGTITHHHAVGRDHMPWYERQRPPPFGAALAAAKHALDPAGILNPGVLVPRAGAG